MSIAYYSELESARCELRSATRSLEETVRVVRRRLTIPHRIEALIERMFMRAIEFLSRRRGVSISEVRKFAMRIALFAQRLALLHAKYVT